jgi:hypothetical protein
MIASVGPTNGSGSRPTIMNDSSLIYRKGDDDSDDNVPSAFDGFLSSHRCISIFRFCSVVVAHLLAVVRG